MGPAQIARKGDRIRVALRHPLVPIDGIVAGSRRGCCAGHALRRFGNEGISQGTAADYGLLRWVEPRPEACDLKRFAGGRSFGCHGCKQTLEESRMKAIVIPGARLLIASAAIAALASC